LWAQYYFLLIFNKTCIKLMISSSWHTLFVKKLKTENWN
jgi:hypothetical protein